MSNKDRLILLTTLLLITLLIAIDLATDLNEGVAIWHLVIEGAAGVMALLGIGYIFRDMVNLKHQLHHQRFLPKIYDKKQPNGGHAQKNILMVFRT